ncbi:hypothetical protein [Halomonas sp.]|uniref:hypothetical protein n=1 Tax=Halomonas sp. TaxID=1486246 RepID=UPI0025BACC4E|nr:hypothetical protein [Halomonas sp.]
MPNKNLPTASVTISFTTEVADLGEEAYALQAEVNEEDNDGETRFIFGEAAPIFRVYKSKNIASINFYPSDGSIGGGGGGGTANVEEIVTFANSRTTNTSYPIKTGTLNATALGNADLGTITAVGPATIQCSKKSSGPTDPLVGVYKINYQSDFTRHSLTGVSKPSGFGEGDFDSYPVHIHVLGLI